MLVSAAAFSSVTDNIPLAAVLAKILAGLGTYGFLRARGLASPASGFGALAYMMSHGSDGMRQASEDAVLNANYVRVGLQDLMSLPFGKWFVMFVMMFILFILGFFISWQGLLYVVVPIFLPVAANLGFKEIYIPRLVVHSRG